MLRLLFHCRPDYIVLSVKPSLFSISILKSFLDYKLVCFVEGDSSKNLFSFLNPTVAKISLFLLEMLIKSADSVFPAYYSAKEWVDRVRSDSKSIIVPVGIDQAVFNDEFASKPNIFNKESFIIGYVGSFRLVHRVDLLIEVLNHDERIKLCLVGDGECFDDIKESVKFLGLADRVEFKGAVDHSYVPEIVSKCDILWGYTDPLHWGVPIKVFEYLALNRPVIASKRREFDFIQKYNFGLTTKSINSREIYDELMCYLSNIKTINSREYILKNYRWDSLGERVRSIVAK